MTYGLGTRAFAEPGPGTIAFPATARRSVGPAWQALDPDRRLTLVEQALGLRA